ncbi:MAG: histidine phosphatase family protein [Nitrospinae bacterium]|nr:histidine phosphatase family protein [Nitrospinota bacterium]
MAELIYLVRHGMTQANAEKRFIGSSNPPLNETGLAQARALSEVFLKLAPEKVYCSPLLRVTQTAMNAMPDIEELSILEDLREVDFGEWENLTQEEIIERAPERFAVMRGNHADFTFPGGEALRDFIARVERVADILKLDSSKSVAVFTHGGVIRYLACRLLGDGYEKTGERYLPPGVVAVFQQNGDAYRVASISGGWRWDS